MVCAGVRGQLECPGNNPSATPIGRKTTASAEYHEPFELLSKDTVTMRRAIASLIEELEAVDWYQQRIDACQDDELKDYLFTDKPIGHK